MPNPKPEEFTEDTQDDRDSLDNDNDEDGDDGAGATAHMNWRQRVELRLAEGKREMKAMRKQIKDMADDLRANHTAVINALEGRTRVIEKIIETFQMCLTGTGAFINKALEAFINPTKGFIVLWLVTVVAVTGMTVGEAFDVVEGIKDYVSDDEIEEEADLEDEDPIQ